MTGISKETHSKIQLTVVLFFWIIAVCVIIFSLKQKDVIMNASREVIETLERFSYNEKAKTVKAAQVVKYNNGKPKLVFILCDKDVITNDPIDGKYCSLSEDDLKYIIDNNVIVRAYNIIKQNAKIPTKATNIDN